MQWGGFMLSGRLRRKRSLFLSVLCLAAALWAAPVRPGVVLGESMSPSFRSGQVFLMSRLGKGRRVGRGDVVIVAFHGAVYLKRVYALGGDTVWGVDSREVQGTPDLVISSSDVKTVRRVARRSAGIGRVMHMEVPPGEVFVLGDAATKSYDSRHFGPVPLEAIRGRVVVAHVFNLWRPGDSSRTVVMAREATPPRLDGAALAFRQ